MAAQHFPIALATYSAAIRANGKSDGKVLGVLGIHFDWEPQAQSIVESVRVDDTGSSKSRSILCTRKF